MHSIAGKSGADPLPSWNDTAAKKAIIAFVAKVTKEGSPDFVPPSERIAVFDNDGTLWCEQPMYTQVAFALDRVKATGRQAPGVEGEAAVQGRARGDHKALAEAGEKGLVEILMATHTGMTIEEFETTVLDWLATARHPKYNRPYTECVYQPMLEVLAYLRANGFKTFIVSGGTVEFMRPWTEKVYGVPPEQVVGTTFKTKYVVKDDKSAVRHRAGGGHDRRQGRQAGRHRQVHRPPAGHGVRQLGRRLRDAGVHHDGQGSRVSASSSTTRTPMREYAYDRKSHIGKLERGLDEAAKRGWVVASMKDDWKSVFPPAK